MHYSDGLKQSPVNIAGPFDEASYTLTYSDKIHPESSKFIRDYKSGILFLEANFGSATFNSEEYDMRGAFFHHPSEHTVKCLLYNLIVRG